MELHWHRWLAPAVSLLAVALVAVVLHHALAEYDLQGVLKTVAAIPARALFIAAAWTAVSYGLLTLNDTLAVRYAGQSLPYARCALASFIAYTFGHNLSLASFTGAAVRYRMYSIQGLSAIEITTVVLFCSLTSFLGLSLLGGGALLFASTGLTTLHLGAAWSRLFGALLVCAALGYLAWSAIATRSLDIGDWSLRPPGLRTASLQSLIAVGDLAAAASVLWWLLPNEFAVDYTSFLGLYAMAVVAGLVSQVPGGLGVFESVLLLGLRNGPLPALLGALLAYRAIYYLAPLLLGSCGLLAHEAWQHRSRLQRARHIAQGWMPTLLTPIAPQLSGVLVFIGGAVLLVSGATPGIDARLQGLVRFLPLPLLELSHLAGSMIGVGLLVLSRALFRRLRVAWHLTSWLLAAGMVTSLLKGLDYEEALFLGIVLAFMQMARPAFYRPSSIISQRYTATWLVSIGAVVALSLWLALFANREISYSHQLWWTFALQADAPRALRASLAVLLLLGAGIAARLLRPAPPAAHDPASLDFNALQPALQCATTSLANAVYSGDKRVLRHPAGDAFLMYQIAGRSWIALGDPVGPEERFEELVWGFREQADRADGRTVFYQVSAEHLSLYVDLGLSLFKIGEEARVPLAGFSLEGPERASLRQSHRRAERDGARFAVLDAGAVPALLPRLRQISDDWLQDKAAAEKGFSLGAFDDAYLCRLPLATIMVDDRIVAFANLWPTATRSELSVDLMRFSADAPRSAMDYLFIELMRWGAAQGYQWFNLGMAPLAGLERRALAPLWHRFGAFLYRHGENFYNFDGLRRFKDKFDPAWEPRYVASPGGIHLARTMYDVSTLISGGLRELVM